MHIVFYWHINNVETLRQEMLDKSSSSNLFRSAAAIHVESLGVHDCTVTQERIYLGDCKGIIST